MKPDCQLWGCNVSVNVGWSGGTWYWGTETIHTIQVPSIPNVCVLEFSEWTKAWILIPGHKNTVIIGSLQSVNILVKLLRDTEHCVYIDVLTLTLTHLWSSLV